MMGNDGYKKDMLGLVIGSITSPTHTFKMLAGAPVRYTVPAVAVFFLTCVGWSFFPEPELGIGLPAISGFKTAGHLVTAIAYTLETIAIGIVGVAVTMWAGNRWGELRAGFRTVFVVLVYAWISPLILWMMVSIGTYALQSGLLYDLGSIAVFIWSIVLWVKGARAIYGYGNAKLLGILVLVLLSEWTTMFATGLAYEPLGYWISDLF